ncbi:MAG: S41 family peptidase [Siphonobacter sp.]
MKYSWLLLLIGLAACSPRAYSPERKFSKESLQADFQILRTSLETNHPGLYWYTSQKQLDSAFNATAQHLDHSMTELEFRRLLDPLIELIHCGHTNVRGSKSFEHWRKKNLAKDFPLGIFEWNGKIYVLANASSESAIYKGQELVKIDGRDAKAIYDTLRRIVISDGYNETFKNTAILNHFPMYYRYWFGEKERYEVTLKDSLGTDVTYEVALRKPEKIKKPVKHRPISDQQRPALPPLQPSIGNKSIQLSFVPYDSSIAIIDLNTFSGFAYRKWFRRVFREIKHHNVQNLVIDLRNNGGGKVAASNRLMRYVMGRPFQAYQSVESRPIQHDFNKYTNERILRWVMLSIVSKRLPDGKRRITYATGVQKPLKKYGYHGEVYILTNGGSFSASSITAANLQFWKRATVIGRETGGGRNGCTAWVIPYLTLPESHLRLRFPLFKTITAVTDPNVGHGVVPDYPVVFTQRDFLLNHDPDMEKVYQLVQRAALTKE